MLSAVVLVPKVPSEGGKAAESYKDLFVLLLFVPGHLPACALRAQDHCPGWGRSLTVPEGLPGAAAAVIQVLTTWPAARPWFSWLGSHATFFELQIFLFFFFLTPGSPSVKPPPCCIGN